MHTPHNPLVFCRLRPKAEIQAPGDFFGGAVFVFIIPLFLGAAVAPWSKVYRVLR